jgi:hypothetical protein
MTGFGDYELLMRIDFHIHPRVDFSNVLLSFFHNFFGSRVLITAMKIGKRVKIPRCRATVSEEICNRSLEETLGRPVAAAGR